MSGERKRSYAEINNTMIALNRILKKYPKLPGYRIEKFLPVYYPIANIKLFMTEQTFEDLETVQLTVMKLISMGINSAEVISKTLGLSNTYILRLLKLLEGYGFIDAGNLTDLGKQSLQKEKKIQVNEVWQNFQIDALGGNLLRVNELISSDDYADEKMATRNVEVLDFSKGIKTQSIISTILNDPIQYINNGEGILNTNVIEIKKAEVIDVQYAVGYLLKLRGFKDVVVFAQRFDPNAKNINERYSWMPFSIGSREWITQYGFEDYIPIKNGECEQYINEIMLLIAEKEKTVDIKEEIPKALRKIYPFADKGVKIARLEGKTIPEIQITEFAFPIYRDWIVDFLLRIHQDGEYLITNEYLLGNLLSLQTNSYFLQDIADLLYEVTKEYGRRAVCQRLRSKLGTFQAPKGEAVLMKQMKIELEKIIEMQEGIDNG